MIFKEFKRMEKLILPFVLLNSFAQTIVAQTIQLDK